jgi:hypothetical protein
MASKPVSLKEQEIFHLQRWQNVNISSKLLKIILRNLVFKPIETPSFENSETLMGNMERR